MEKAQSEVPEHFKARASEGNMCGPVSVGQWQWGTRRPSGKYLYGGEVGSKDNRSRWSGS